MLCVACCSYITLPRPVPCPASAWNRNIDKAGGLDNYILQTPPHKLDSDVGEELRLKMLGERERRQRQRQLPRAAAAAAAVAEGANQAAV